MTGVASSRGFAASRLPSHDERKLGHFHAAPNDSVSPCVGTMPLWGTSVKSLGARARGHFAFTYCEPMSFQLKVRDVVQADSVTKARGRVAFGTAACAVESP